MSDQPCRAYLPPEWANQSAVMLTWPHDQSDWAPHLPQVEPVFVDIARHIGAREKLLVVCRDNNHREHVQDLLTQAGVARARLILAIAPSNDTWARDHGPLSVLCREQPALLDFHFNGWGGKYPADRDNAITATLHAQGIFGKLPREPMDLVLEGGSIEVDGTGSLLTTERCLLAPTRNPQLNRQQLEQELGQLLGVTRVLWLKHGYLAGDDTDSHIDTLARFCDANTIAYVQCDDPQDEHYPELQAMEAELQALRTRANTPYRLIPLPWPRPKFDADKQRLPATYANFLIINGAVLMPTYDDPADTLARQRLQTAFPDREIIGVPCLPLILQHGSLHCVTMQLPAGVL